MRRADACVHLAAALGVENVVDNPLETLLANVRGADVVMAAAARHARKLLFASSSEVYGKQSGEALTELDDCTIGAPSRSRWSYAIAKQFGESLAHAYVQCEGADIAAVRFFNVVGPRQSTAYGMVLPRFMDQALANEPLTIYGDGSQTRCFTSVYDAVRAVVGLLDSDSAAGATYNIGSSTPVRIDDLAARVIKRSRSRSRTICVPYARAYGSGYEAFAGGRPEPARDRIQRRSSSEALSRPCVGRSRPREPQCCNARDAARASAERPAHPNIDLPWTTTRQRRPAFSVSSDRHSAGDVRDSPTAALAARGGRPPCRRQDPIEPPRRSSRRRRSEGRHGPRRAGGSPRPSRSRSTPSPRRARRCLPRSRRHRPRRTRFPRSPRRARLRPASRPGSPRPRRRPSLSPRRS